MDAYLGVVPDRITGLFHGALFRSRPAPSGSPRWMLSATLSEGFTSARMAAQAANSAFPEAVPVDLDSVPDLDFARFDDVPAGSVLTVATPRRKEGAGNAPECEVRLPGGQGVGQVLSPEEVRLLVASGRLVPESSSGDDPELDCRYDHYVFARRR